MQSKAESPEEDIAGLPENRKKAISELRKIIKKNLPKGFKDDEIRTAKYQVVFKVQLALNAFV